MATNTGFKQQCPHCEARVPVKDESLIGEEINCPKCKKPFVVEDPEDTESAEAESKRRPKKAAPKEREDAEEQPSKERDKKKSKLVLGLALAGVAVLLLGVAAFFMLGSSDNKPNTASSGGGSAPRAGGAASAPQAQKAAAAPAQPAAGTGPAGVAGIIQANPTNLLPNDTEIVLNLQMKELLANRFGQMLFDAHGSESHSFGAAYGIPVHDMERILSAGNVTEGWSFVIFRTNKGIRFESVKKALHLREPELPIQGQEYFLTSFNWLPPESPIKVGESGSATTTEAPGTRPLAVRLVDSQTLALGDVSPMKNFLAVKGQPQTIKQPAAASPPAKAAPPSPPPAPANPPGGRGRGPGQPSSQSVSDAPPDARTLQAGSAQPQPASSIAPVASSSYMTIHPQLKAMLDRMESRPPVLFSFAFDAEADRKDAVGMDSFGFNVDLRTVGLALHMKDKNIGLLGFECKADAAAKELQKRLDTDLRGLTAALKLVGLEVEFAGGGGGLNAIRGRAPGGAPPGGGRRGGAPGGAPGSPPGPGGATITAPSNVSTARFTLTQQGVNLQVTAEVQTDARVLERIADEIEPYLVRAQGVLEMTTAHPNPNQLGLTARLYRESRAQFPRGTVKRKPSPARANRPWPPDQRVSWMAELLPFLGYEGTYSRIKADKSWQDKENIVPAVSLVAPFLDGRSHERDWYVRYPRMSYDVAATHFVGVAGIGLGAAEYSRGDPAVAKKLGIFGYDRETRVADIVDGLSNTIMMLQVPRAFKCPWMAGGGSTIRGVPETRCVQPFVSTEYEGKRGTFAIMADGSVRFVSENVSDEVFRALCTIKGEGPKLNLDKLAPVVPPPADDLPPQKAQLDAAPPVK